jgi:hypothetical protein
VGVGVPGVLQLVPLAADGLVAVADQRVHVVQVLRDHVAGLLVHDRPS